jgi:hypothetical protein
MRRPNGVTTAVWRSCRHVVDAPWFTGERPQRRVIATPCRQRKPLADMKIRWPQLVTYSAALEVPWITGTE